ncbi:uncharacterized protein LOC117081646 [Trachypithecus francoisi]|uniref:uncharacterized protein LOC117081646 n=1 Tax=Trachypithecus francoisi TaxID=54180 RepID=UPI00141A7EC9|nr:uncharacterized protein LOC117081646 [Trachypithecus francoisi]
MRPRIAAPTPALPRRPAPTSRPEPSTRDFASSQLPGAFSCTLMGASVFLDAGFFIKRRNNASGQVTHVTGVMHWCSPGRALCLREPRGRRGVGAPRGGRAAPARPSGLTALV